MFTRCEGVLLDFADKAESNSIQSGFFDTIQIVKAKHPQVEEQFLNELTQGFNAFRNGLPIKYKTLETKSQNPCEWSLIDHHKLEDEVAIQKIAESTQNKHFQQFHEFSQRMSLVRGGKVLEEQDIPSSPIHVAKCFQSASACFDLEMRTRLIIYALFSKFVMKSLGEIYEDYNSTLISAGVFPNLRPIVIKSEANKAKQTQNRKPLHTPSPSSVDASKNQENQHSNQNLGEELFETISDLLAKRREEDLAYHMLPTMGQVDRIATTRLVDTIGIIQPRSTKQSRQLTPTDNNEASITPDIDKAVISELRTSLHNERTKLFDKVDKRKLMTADLDTIELVGMLFEQVLDDPVLPNAAKALICHLHTPYLKAAVIDSRTITDNQHPTQILLNLMVETGCQWVDETDLETGIYPKMDRAINRVLNEFKENIDLFDELLSSYRQSVELLKKKTLIIERRSQESASGRDKLLNARTQVNKALHTRIQGQTLSPMLDHFLKQSWTDMLTLMALRNPDCVDSTEWQNAMEIVDQLITLANNDASQRLNISYRSQLRDLKQSVKSHLLSLGDYPEKDIDDLFQQLTRSHYASPGKATTDSGIYNEQNIEHQKSNDLTAEEQTMLKKLKSISYGTWFEFKYDDATRPQRVKLSWFSPLSSRYMFVNQSGTEAFMLPANKLVKDLSAGHAKVLGQSKSLFVENALMNTKEKLESNLKSKLGQI